MKTLQSIIEDDKGNVIGASTDAGDIMLAASEVVPRSQLRTVAVTLATRYDVEIPSELRPIVQPGTP